MLKILFVNMLLKDFKSCLNKGYQRGITKSPSLRQLIGQTYSGKSLPYEYDYNDVFQAAHEEAKKLFSKYSTGNYSNVEKETAKRVFEKLIYSDKSENHKQIAADSIIRAFLGWEDYNFGKNNHKEKIYRLMDNPTAIFYF